MKSPALIFTTLLLANTIAFAAERIETVDANKDGFAETKNIFENNKKVRIEVDENKDGNPDLWVWLTEKGVTFRTWRDTDKDTKPDTFYTMLQGRNRVLREFDINNDGKVDKRTHVTWDPSKKTQVPGPNNTMQRIPMPGYVTDWREEDKDFDGIIDEYVERGNKEASGKKVGKKIDTEVTKTLPQKPQEAKKEKVAAEGEISKLVREKNEKLKVLT